MEFEECRTEASIGLENSEGTLTALCNGDETRSTSVKTATREELFSPSKKRKRKRNSSPYSPNTTEGFGNSQAGELLTQFPELKEMFTIVCKVGEGTFSNVYLARMQAFPDELWALKHIIPTSGPERIENELQCLQHIGGIDNVIGVESTYRRNDHIVFVLPYFPHQKFQDYLLDMSVCEIREYMKNLFIALKRVHAFEVIHRDVKPSNFLYCREKKRYTLVDFGLAMQVPGSKNSLLGPPKGKIKSIPMPSSPKASKLPTRRSTRLSPQIENEDIDSLDFEENGTQKPLHKEHKSVLRPSRIYTLAENVQFKRNAKNFKVPTKNPSSRIRTRTQLYPKESSKSSKTLCPIRHSPEEICTACISRGHQNAPRAGTPGFRSPEVLLKYPNQTTAVDIWSAGIILLCALSGRYPFFRAYDDMTALAQIISVTGSSESIKVANELAKDLVTNSKFPPGNLKAACQRLRLGSSISATTKCISRDFSDDCDSGLDYSSKKHRRNSTTKRKSSKSKGVQSNNDSHHYCAMCRGDCSNENSSCGVEICKGLVNQESSSECTGVTKVHLDGSECSYQCCKCCWTGPESAYNLLQRCLDLNPQTRITASEALQHPFFVELL